MKHFLISIIFMILCYTPCSFAQDARATSDDGQTVILRKNGKWFYFNPSTSADQINKLPEQGTKATMSNGQIVILKNNGTWVLTASYQTSAVQYTKTRNPKVAVLAKSGHWDEEFWELHHAMLEKPASKLELSEWMNGSVPQEAWPGKIVVVDFWATWCGPCLNAIQHNSELYRQYKEQGVLIIGACGSGRGGGQERMADAARQYGLDYPTAKVAENYVKMWNVMYWPTYAIVDRNGTLRAIGVQPDFVEPIIKALLEEH